MARIVTSSGVGGNKGLDGGKSSGAGSAAVKAPGPFTPAVKLIPGPKGPPGDPASISPTLTLPEVFINPLTGNDANLGSSLDPLATLGEWARRVRNYEFLANQVVHVAFATYTDIVNIVDLRIARGVTVTVRGVRTVLRTSTFTGVTPWNFSEPGPQTTGRLIDSTIPTGWSADGLLGKLITFDSGGVETWSWAAAQDGGNPRSAITNPPVDPVSYFELGDNVEPSIATPYTIYNLPRIGQLLIDVDGPGALVFEFLEISPPVIGDNILTQVGNTRFRACNFLNLSGNFGMNIRRGDITLVGCRCSGSGLFLQAAAGVNIFGGLMHDLDTRVADGCSASIQLRLLAYLNSTFTAQGGTIEVVYDEFGIALIAGTLTQLTTLRRGRIVMHGRIWGTGTGAGPAVEAQTGSIMEYDASRQPRITGFTTDCRIGSLTSTYASLPQTDTNRLSAIIQT